MFTQFAAKNSGDLRIKAATCASGENLVSLRPVANSYVKLWSQSPSSGTEFDKVDEAVADGNNTYIWDDTKPSNFVAFSHQSLSLSSDKAVKRVAVYLVARRSGNAASVAPGLYLGGNFYSGTTNSAGPNYSEYSNTWLSNPAGGSWTASSVNSAGVAARSSRVNQGNALSITQMWMDVCWVYKAPMVNIKANGSNGPITIPYNSAATLSWSSSYATSCPGFSATSGSKSIGKLTSSRTFSITCTGKGGSGSDSVRVNLSAPPTSGGGGSDSSPPPSSGGETKAKPTVASISLRTSANAFLINGKEVEATIKGTSVTKKVTFSKDATSVSLKTSALTVGKTYILELKTPWLLTQNFSFKLKSGVKLAAGPLIFGDVTADNRISETDIVEFLAGFINDQNYDFNADGVVNSFDYSILINNLK